MDSAPLYRVLAGTFVVAGYAPDGDSLRFVPDRPHELDPLPSTHRLRFAKDGSVPTRLEGIDAPELHYDRARQPLGQQSRDALLVIVGFTHVDAFDDVVRASTPAFVRGAILTRAIDPQGRVIAYALADPIAKTLRTDRRTRIPRALLRETFNAAMLARGMAYPLAYDTQPEDHRTAFASLAREARASRRGVWSRDRTKSFRLAGRGSIGARGALIFPKLFRRCVAFLEDRLAGFDGTIARWLESEAGGDNDVVMVGRELTRLSAVLGQVGEVVQTKVDVTRVVFVAR